MMNDLVEIWNKYSLNILLSLVVFLGFLFLSYAIDMVLKRVSRKIETHKSEAYNLISSSQKTVLIVIGLISALGTLGVNVSALVAGLGLTGFALGLALKDAISNTVAGVMIVFYRPFELGDHIELTGVKGEVVNINLRYITLNNEDKKYLIPNSLFLNNKIALHQESKD